MLSDKDFECLVQCLVESLDVHAVEIENVVLFYFFVSKLHNEVASYFKRSLSDQCHFMQFFTICQFRFRNLYHFRIRELKLKLDKTNLRYIFVKL